MIRNRCHENFKKSDKISLNQKISKNNIQSRKKNKYIKNSMILKNNGRKIFKNLTLKLL